MRKRDEVRVHRQQHQFDCHQDDDHVTSIQKNSDDADREQDRAEHQVMGKTQHGYLSPQPLLSTVPAPALPVTGAWVAASGASLSDFILTSRTRSCART